MSDDRVSALLAELQNPSTRNQAIQALGAMQAPQALEPLRQILMNRNDNHAMAYLSRRYAAEALGSIGDAQATPHLIYALEDDPSSAVKASAASALAQINDPAAIEPLANALQERNAEVQIATARAFGRLAAAHGAALTPLVAHFTASEDHVRENAHNILRDLGEQALPALIDALKDPNSTIRGAAAQVLGEIKSERARQPLREASLRDSSQWVRSRANWALSQLPKLDAMSPSTQPDGTLRPSPIQSALDTVRRNAPSQWPTPNPNQSPPDPKPGTVPNNTNNTMKTELDPIPPEQVQQMLDALDVRLANGEITEATYRQLVERWKKRLE